MKNRRFLQKTITRNAEEVETYVGIPLTDDLRQKLQELTDHTVTRSQEEVAAFALEVGMNRLLGAYEDEASPRDDERSPATDYSASHDNERTAQEEISLLARAFEVREQLTTPASITLSLATKERYVFDRLRKARPDMTLDDIITMVVGKGIAQVMKENDITRTEPGSLEVYAKKNLVNLNATRAARRRRW